MINAIEDGRSLATKQQATLELEERQNQLSNLKTSALKITNKLVKENMALRKQLMLPFVEIQHLIPPPVVHVVPLGTRVEFGQNIVANLKSRTLGIASELKEDNDRLEQQLAKRKGQKKSEKIKAAQTTNNSPNVTPTVVPVTPMTTAPKTFDVNLNPERSATTPTLGSAADEGDPSKPLIMKKPASLRSAPQLRRNSTAVDIFNPQSPAGTRKDPDAIAKEEDSRFLEDLKFEVGNFEAVIRVKLQEIRRSITPFSVQQTIETLKRNLNACKTEGEVRGVLAKEVNTPAALKAHIDGEEVSARVTNAVEQKHTALEEGMEQAEINEIINKILGQVPHLVAKFNEDVKTVRPKIRRFAEMIHRVEVRLVAIPVFKNSQTVAEFEREIDRHIGSSQLHLAQKRKTNLLHELHDLRPVVPVKTYDYIPLLLGNKADLHDNTPGNLNRRSSTIGALGNIEQLLEQDQKIKIIELDGNPQEVRLLFRAYIISNLDGKYFRQERLFTSFVRKDAALSLRARIQAEVEEYNVWALVGKYSGGIGTFTHKCFYLISDNKDFPPISLTNRHGTPDFRGEEQNFVNDALRIIANNGNPVDKMAMPTLPSPESNTSYSEEANK